MNKLTKILSTLAVVFIGVFALASCGDKGYTNNDFYEEYVEAGVDNLKKDHIFEMITADDVASKIEAKESFIVYLGSSSIPNDVDTIKALAFDAENTNYDGKINFINLDLYQGRTKKEELNTKLGISYDGDTKILCVCYKEGKLEFTTTKLTGTYETLLTDANGELDAHRLAAFTFDFNKKNSK